jgi:UDP-2,3-diacylglucosamine pyrophosphatase LpxH
MSENPFYIVSDTHLGAVPRSTEAAFRRFLAGLRGRASGLLIGGDLFDILRSRP